MPASYTCGEFDINKHDHIGLRNNSDRNQYKKSCESKLVSALHTASLNESSQEAKESTDTNDSDNPYKKLYRAKCSKFMDMYAAS